MAEITLKAESGRPTGTRPSKRLRAEGRIPGVVYGQGSEATAVSVDWKELRQALSTDAGLNALIDLDLDGDTRLSIVKELQRDPVRRNVTHVDVLLISRDEAILVEVPIVLEGEAESVYREDGMVDQVLTLLPVRAKPADIPNEITFDISGLTLGETVRVADLALPAGVESDLEPDEPVVTTSVTRAAMEEEEEAEAAEAEAAAAAEGEGGQGGGSEEAKGGEAEG
jgi:large subunit ribosomal protein L25